MKVNADFRLFAATRFDATKYIPSPSYGVNRFMLDRIGDEKARATTIVEYEPNSKFPEHTHIGGEEFLVLEGTFKDQFGEFPAGTYVRNPIDSKHAPWVDDDGCTIFVKLLQMADTSEGTTPIHVDLEKAKATAKESAALGMVAELYRNDQTGERVEICWTEPDKEVGLADGEAGGEELFVIKGSVVCQGTEYAKWGWLRFPAELVEERKTLRTGKDGAQFYRKTGHLTESALAMEKVHISNA
ncbi:hypothetical protein ACA910_021047 [Epithemia clementina (nom. ined.)]